jgi:hypothetical protein
MVGISRRRQALSRDPASSSWEPAAEISDEIQSLIWPRATSERFTNRKPASFFESLIRAISPMASSQSFDPGN